MWDVTPLPGTEALAGLACQGKPSLLRRVPGLGLLLRGLSRFHATQQGDASPSWPRLGDSCGSPKPVDSEPGTMKHVTVAPSQRLLRAKTPGRAVRLTIPSLPSASSVASSGLLSLRASVSLSLKRTALLVPVSPVVRERKWRNTWQCLEQGRAWCKGPLKGRCRH